MSILNQIGRSIISAGDGVTKRGKAFAETAQLNSQLSDNKKKITSLYAAIGEAYYNRHKDDPNAEEQALISEIRTYYMQNSQIEEQIKQVNGVTRCQYCGAEILIDAQFCSSCGRDTGRKASRACPRCGASVAAGMNFCTSCGCKMPDETTASAASASAASAYAAPAPEAPVYTAPAPEAPVYTAPAPEAPAPAAAQPENPPEASAYEPVYEPVYEQERVCPNCHAILTDDDIFCPECGTDMRKETVASQPQPAAQPQPGAPLRCPNCHTEISAEDIFCPECGADLR